MTALNSKYEKFRSTSKYGRLSKWLNYAKESRGIKQKEVRVVPAQCSLLFIAGLLEPVGHVSPLPRFWQIHCLYLNRGRQIKPKTLLRPLQIFRPSYRPANCFGLELLRANISCGLPD